MKTDRKNEKPGITVRDRATEKLKNCLSVFHFPDNIVFFMWVFRPIRL